MWRYAWIAVNALFKPKSSTLGSTDGHKFNVFSMYLFLTTRSLCSLFLILRLSYWGTEWHPKILNDYPWSSACEIYTDFPKLRLAGCEWGAPGRQARIRAKLSPWKGNKMLAVLGVVLALAQKYVSEPCRWAERFLESFFHLTIACCFQK